MSKLIVTRRRLLGLGAAGASSLALAGCDAFDSLGERGGDARSLLELANDVTYRVQRLLQGRDALAPEYAESEIRQGQAASMPGLIARPVRIMSGRKTSSTTQ